MSESSKLVEQFFLDLENPELYERVDGVPVFGRHVKLEKLPDGSWRKVEVDGGTLEEIAKEINRLEAEKGVLPVITAGHRSLDPKTNEQDQPQPWGYMRYAKTGFYTTPSGKQVPTLLTTWYLDKKKKAKDGLPVNLAAKTYPKRSVDYYADTHEISGVALLRRDSELDLGNISYGRSKRPLCLYATENLMDPTMPPSVEDNVGEGEMSDELTPEEAGMADRYMKHYERNHAPTKYMCDRYTAECGGGVDKPLPVSDKAPNEKGKDMNQMAKGELPAQYAREKAVMESKLTSLEKRLAATEKELAEKNREGRLMQFSRELDKRVQSGQITDIEGEMEFVKDFTPGQFDAYMARIDKNYTAAPVGKTAPLGYARNTGHEGVNGGGTKLPADKNGLLPEGVQAQVFQYMREHLDCKYEDAAKAVVK